MSSLKADFDELRERIRHGRELGHASFEPIYYLVFPPEQILDVKQTSPRRLGCSYIFYHRTDMGTAQGRFVVVALCDGGQICSVGLAADQ